MPGAVAERAIHIEGIRELQRAFAVASREMSKDLRMALESAGSPVAEDAGRRALSEISGLKRSVIPWHRMRVGVSRGVVWVAPEQRGVKTNARARMRRGWDSGPPSFPSLLLEKAMIPALEENKGRVEQEIEDAITDMARAWGRV